MIRWQETPLEDALEALIDYRGKSPTKSERGIPVISAKVVKDGRILDNIEQTIAPEYYSEWMRRGSPQVGDVIMTTEGPLGEVARLDETTANYALGQRIVTLRGRAGILDNGFLKYLLISAPIQERLQSRATGSTVSGISQKSLREMNIPIAPLSEQREIASILGALDDKIDLNRRMAATLEEMARSLYRSWFVDFDPVHAKAAGRQPAFMDEETAALFPDRFGEDGLPKGWRMVGLPEIATFLNGAALQKFPEEEGIASLSVIKIAELRNGVTPRSGRATSRIPKKYLVNNGDVLFSWSGSLLQKVWTEGQGALNQHLFKVTSDIVPKWFHFFGVDQHIEDFQLTAQSKATTMGHIQRHHLDDAKVCLPSEEVLSAADLVVQPIFDKAIAALLENHTLAALRDSLLPKLMSGEIRVGEAREQIEEHA